MGWDGPCSGDTLPLSSSFSSFSPIFPEGPERYMEEEEEEDRGSRKREGGRTDDDDDGPITYQVEGQPAPPPPPPGLRPPPLPLLPLLLINAGRNIISFVAAGWGRKKVLPATSLSFSSPPSFPPSQAPYDVASAFVYLLGRKPGVEERSTRESRVPNRILFFAICQPDAFL